MDQLLWLLERITVRNAVLAGAGVLAFLAAVNLQGYPRQAYMRWRYPSVKAAPDPAITAALDRRESLELRGRYRKIQALLEEARAAGFNVDGHERKAQAIMKLERARMFNEAKREFIALEMRIPRKRVQYIPMDEEARASNEAWPGEQPQSIGSSEREHASRTKKARRRRR